MEEGAAVCRKCSGGEPSASVEFLCLSLLQLSLKDLLQFFVASQVTVRVYPCIVVVVDVVVVVLLLLLLLLLS